MNRISKRRRGGPTKSVPSSLDKPANNSPHTADVTVVSVSDEKSLEKLRGAVVDAASVSTPLWVSYLFTLFYFAIAVGSVNHRDLFLENAIKLPFLNVDLPLATFFVVGPAIFLVVHAYVLLHLLLFANKIGIFHIELQAQITDENVRTNLRRQLPNNVFIQILAGPRDVRAGFTGVMLRLISQISLVVAPIGLLLFFQIKFLPYHNESITWWHRIAVMADLILLWLLWPSVTRGAITKLSWPDFRRPLIAATAIASALIVVFVGAVATFPGEWLDDAVPTLHFIPVREKEHDTWERRSLHEILFAGEIDLVARQPKSVWSNRIVLPGIDVIDRAKFDTESKIAAVDHTVSLRGRRLEGAVLIGANLRKVDFTGARLKRALLNSADLREAKFGCGLTIGQSSDPKNFEMCTDLRGASLIHAELTRTHVAFTNLEGAILQFVHAEGASLWRSRLSAADLFGAFLTGAILDEAQLQGANLGSAVLRGASLDRVSLLGSNLSYADMTGASVRYSDLLGSDLSGANISAARLLMNNVWRSIITRVETLGMEASQVAGNVADPEYRDLEDSGSRVTLTTETYLAFRRKMASKIPDGPAKASAMERFDRLDPMKNITNDAESKWIQISNRSEGDKLNAELVPVLTRAVCNSIISGPFLIEGLIRRPTIGTPVSSNSGLDQRSRLQHAGSHAAALADAFLDDRCVGARGLSEVARRALRDFQVGKRN